MCTFDKIAIDVYEELEKKLEEFINFNEFSEENGYKMYYFGCIK